MQVVFITVSRNVLLLLRDPLLALYSDFIKLLLFSFFIRLISLLVLLFSMLMMV